MPTVIFDFVLLAVLQRGTTNHFEWGNISRLRVRRGGFNKQVNKGEMNGFAFSFIARRNERVWNRLGRFLKMLIISMSYTDIGRHINKLINVS